MELPTITATTLAGQARAFATQLATDLENINVKYPDAQIGVESQEVLEKAFTSPLPGPTPFELVPAFERLFALYMASRYVIVPD